MQESAEAAQVDVIRSLTAQRDAAEAARQEAEKAADDAAEEAARLTEALQGRAGQSLQDIDRCESASGLSLIGFFSPLKIWHLHRMPCTLHKLPRPARAATASCGCSPRRTPR